MKVKAKLVKRSVCECGADAVWEHVPIGKEYLVYPESVAERKWMCTVCGKTHTSKVITVDDGVKGLGFLFLDLFEFDEGVAP